jgi:hypothetical protein
MNTKEAEAGAQQLTNEELKERAETIRYRIYKTVEKHSTKEEMAILTEYARRYPTNRNWTTVSAARSINHKKP